jgi:hypothetical protein
LEGWKRPGPPEDVLFKLGLKNEKVYTMWKRGERAMIGKEQ